jgi:hypothetical protein
MATLSVTMVAVAETQTQQILPAVLRSIPCVAVAETETSVAGGAIPTQIACAALAGTESATAEASVRRRVLCTVAMPTTTSVAVLGTLYRMTHSSDIGTETGSPLAEIITGRLRMVVSARRPSIRVG